MKENLLKEIPSNRIILLEGIIEDKIAERVNKNLLKCDSNYNSPILLAINSPGGSVTSAFSITGIIKLIKSPIVTYSTGQSCSAASLLLMNGTRGLRCADINSTIMMHYGVPKNGDINQLSANDLSEINKVNLKMERFICSATKQNIAKVRKVMRNEYYFSAIEAVSFGIIDFLC